MYPAPRDQGVEAALALYRDLKRDAASHDEFSEYDLLIMADKLLENEKFTPAIAMLELSLEEYPESSSAGYTNFDLAKAYNLSGDRAAAVRYCRKALELSPDSERIAAFLEELESSE